MKGMTFPFVTLPDFEVYGRKARTNSGIEVLGWIPYIGQDKLAAFNNYSQASRGWIETSQTLDQELQNAPFPYENFDLIPFVHDVVVDLQTGEQSISPSTNGELFSPVWQSSPPPVSGFLLMTNTETLDVDPHPEKAVREVDGEFSSKILKSKIETDLKRSTYLFVFPQTRQSPLSQIEFFFFRKRSSRQPDTKQSMPNIPEAEIALNPTHRLPVQCMTRSIEQHVNMSETSLACSHRNHF